MKIFSVGELPNTLIKAEESINYECKVVWSMHPVNRVYLITSYHISSFVCFLKCIVLKPIHISRVNTYEYHTTAKKLCIHSCGWILDRRWSSGVGTIVFSPFNFILKNDQLIDMYLMGTNHCCKTSRILLLPWTCLKQSANILRIFWCW